MLVSEENYEIFEKVHNLNLNDYEIKWFNAENIDGYIEPNTMLDMIEDLLWEIDHWKEKYEDLENAINNDYDPEIEIPQIHGKGISW